MNAYTTQGQARIQRRDNVIILLTDWFMAAALAATEWQRGWQAEAEVVWLLKQNALTPHATASHAAMLWQTIGAALVRAAERLAGAPRSGVPLEMAAAASTQGATPAG